MQGVSVLNQSHAFTDLSEPSSVLVHLHIASTFQLASKFIRSFILVVWKNPWVLTIIQFPLKLWLYVRICHPDLIGHKEFTIQILNVGVLKIFESLNLNKLIVLEDVSQQREDALKTNFHDFPSQECNLVDKRSML